MTPILVILTLAIIIAFEVVRRSRSKPALETREMVAEHPNDVEVFDRHFHPSHTWAIVSGSKTVTVGADDFSESIIGRLTSIDLPKVGRTFQQGEPIAYLHHGSRNLAQISPITGKVIEINEKLARHPTMLNDSPLERGWIAKILPSNLEIDLRNLLRGVAADGWRDAVRMELVRMFSPSFGPVLQDGGKLIENLGDHFSDDEWNRLVQKFFPIITPKQQQNKSKN
jgi:glycine cleavage system H protein